MSLPSTPERRIPNRPRPTLDPDSLSDDELILMPHTPIWLPGSPSFELVDEDDDRWDGGSGSMPPPSPTPQAPKKGKARQHHRSRSPGPSAADIKSLCAIRWQQWCEHYGWVPDEYFQQQLGFRVMLYDNAKAFFRFTDLELGTIPYYGIHSRTKSARMYRFEDLKRLAHRREAGLRDLADSFAAPGADTEEDMLEAGKPYFELRLENLEKRYFEVQLKKRCEGRLGPHESLTRKGPETFRIVGGHR